MLPLPPLTAIIEQAGSVRAGYGGEKMGAGKSEIPLQRHFWLQLCVRLSVHSGEIANYPYFDLFSQLSFIIVCPLLWSFLIWLSLFCFVNTIEKNKTSQYKKWYDTMIAEVKERILSERQDFPKKHPEKMIFSLLHGVLVQASPFNDNGS